MLKKLNHASATVNIKDTAQKFKTTSKSRSEYFTFQKDALAQLKRILANPGHFPHFAVCGAKYLDIKEELGGLIRSEFLEENTASKFFYDPYRNEICPSQYASKDMYPLFLPDSRYRPVLYEPIPNLLNLLGIPGINSYKRGLLLSATGGYLILPLNQLFSDYRTYEALRTCIYRGLIDFSGLENIDFPLEKTQALPAFPLNLRLILVGSEYYYEYFYQRDHFFREIFPIRVDLKNEVENTPQNRRWFYEFLDSLQLENYPKINFSGKKTLLKEAFRLNESQKFFSLNRERIRELYTEAVILHPKKAIGETEIEKAKELILQRYSSNKNRYYEALQAGLYRLEMKGKRLGRINGLSIVTGIHSNYEYGQVSIISARVFTGSGNLTNIEREVNLSGDIHDKGVLIISSYLKALFGGHLNISLDASVTFEQNSSIIDGDSASIAQFLAVLSALSECKIPANLAVTGAMSQYGDALPIGEVNKKIEAFYEISSLIGTPKEIYRVFIPESNVKDLILSDTVLEAIKKGFFEVLSYAHIEDLIQEILGLPLGKADKEGSFPEGSLMHVIQQKLEKKKELEKASV